MIWSAAPSAAAIPVPLEYWALREVVREVEVSPDGNHLALMKIDSRNGNPVIEIYETANLERQPQRLGADPMEFMSLTWVSDDSLMISVRQRLYKRIRSFVKYGENFTIADLLPSEPDTILISESRINTVR